MADISAIKVNGVKYTIGSDIKKIKVNNREYAIGTDLTKIKVNNVEYSLVDAEPTTVGLNITSMPKTIFAIGEAFSLSGLTVKLLTEGGEVYDVTDKMSPSISVGYVFKIGDKGVYKTVTLTYSDATYTGSVSYDITIINDIKLAFEWNYNRNGSATNNSFAWTFNPSEITYAQIEATNTSSTTSSSYKQTNSIVVEIPLKAGGVETKTLLSIPMTSTSAVTTKGSLTLDFTDPENSKYDTTKPVTIKSANNFSTNNTRSSGTITIKGIGDYSNEINISEKYTTYDTNCNACVCEGYPGYIERLVMRAASSQIMFLYAMKQSGGSNAVLYKNIGSSDTEFPLANMDWDTYNPDHYIWLYPYITSQYRTLYYKIKYSES